MLRASSRRCVLLILLSLVFIAFARFHVVRPVQALVDGTRRVALDQLDTEIRVGSRGEMGLLAASFNDMTPKARDNLTVLFRVSEDPDP